MIESSKLLTVFNLKFKIMNILHLTDFQKMGV